MAYGSLTFDDFVARRFKDRRLARLTHDISLPSGRGLEFGAADNPTCLPRKIEISYLDYAIDACANLPAAVTVEHAWAGSGSLREVIGQHDYDFAIAAQVAQYVPNLLGWLRGIHSVLRAGGVLNLSIPDKRFMFDAARSDSSLAELIEADLLAHERPSPRQVFAHTYEARVISPQAIWEGADPLQAPRMSGDEALAHAQSQAAAALTEGRYVLCHCWVFTPVSFLGCLLEATRLGLFPFVLNQISGTSVNDFEFYVSMRRDAETDPVALKQKQIDAIEYLRSTLLRRRTAAALLAR